MIAGRSGSVGECSFSRSPSGRSPPSSPARRRGSSFPSSGRASPRTAGRCSPVGNLSAVAPVASGRGACQSSSRGRMAGSVGQHSESYPPNSRRQNEGRAVSVGGAAGCCWWVSSRVRRLVSAAASLRAASASSSRRRKSSRSPSTCPKSSRKSLVSPCSSCVSDCFMSPVSLSKLVTAGKTR